ncbi:MAG: phosphotransferase family protein [Acidimicrobiales bacterium]
MADSAEAVRDGDQLDWPALRSFLSREMPELDGELQVAQFPGGSANLTYLIGVGDRELVLRRPPFGTIAPGAHDMKREFKVLSRLWQHLDRAPRAYAFCDDPAVIGSDFFVMERREGEVIRDEIPDSMRQHPEVGRRVGFAVIDAFADLALLDPLEVGLADLGKPQGFVERQVRGWADRWSRVCELWDEPLMVTVAEVLAQRLPDAQRVSLVHNDPKLDNCMFAADNPDRATAIFDWDMTTVGDPLVDLGTLLNYWPDPSDPPGAWRGREDSMREFGLPTRAEVVARYAARTGFDCSEAQWYEAFAQWKTAVVVAQLHHRWRMGNSANPRHETIGDAVPTLAASAASLLGV